MWKNQVQNNDVAVAENFGKPAHKARKTVLWVILALVVLLVLCAVAGYLYVTNALKEFGQMSIDMPATLEMEVGASQEAVFVLSPEDMQVSVELTGEAAVLQENVLMADEAGQTTLTVTETGHAWLSGVVKQLGGIFGWEYSPLTASCVITVVEPLKDVDVAVSELSLVLNKTDEKAEKLEYTAVPQTATDVSYSFSSSDEGVAKVDKTGKVTAVGRGTAVITIKATAARGEVEKKVSVTVHIAATQLTINKSETSLVAGRQEKLTAEVLPEDADIDIQVQWESSDTSVATVDDDGTVHAVAAGKADITASTEGGLSSVCTVTVSALPAVIRTAADAAAAAANGSFDTSNAAVNAALAMVGQTRKCTEVAEAAANVYGKSGWGEAADDMPVVMNGVNMTYGEAKAYCAANGYSSVYMSALTPESFIGLGTQVAAADIRPGDILYYADGGRGESHVAVYVGSGMAVHGNWTTAGETCIANAFYRTPTYIIRLG